ncbi:SAV_2336 N-terminal domain-related protein [Streptomyces sp. NPDC093248]|uniref:SAV_2336 N-terminal domain-related protein n=1 Tax=Streptomyces sp. NPDC093248 TaxID=3155072 RepID=UPI00344A5ED4
MHSVSGHSSQPRCGCADSHDPTEPCSAPTRLEQRGSCLLDRVVRVLSESGVELGSDELLDILWLAVQLPPEATPLAAASGTGPGRARTDRAGDPEQPGASEAPPRQTAPPAPSVPTVIDTGAEPPPTPPFGGPGPGAPLAPPPPPPPPVPLHASPVPNPRTGVAVRARPLRAPADDTPHAGQLQMSRSMRPLKLRVLDPHGWELDETATADAMAEGGLTDAVLRPARVRWLNAVLIVDDGTSMLLWQRLVSQVQGLLERAGAFRTVRVLGLETRAAHAPWLTHRPFLRGAAPLPPSTVTDPAGHTLVLVISDGAGAAWRDGRMARQLELWARSGPTAVLHALPPQLWGGSGIRAETWQVTTRRRGAPNAAWEVKDPILPPHLAPFGNRVPVPVLAAEPSALARWAALVASPGSGSVLPLLTGPPTVAPRTGSGAEADTARTVLRFRDTSSAEAYRLAAHLAAVAPVSVPVMRLVQRAIGPDTTTGHLAEVFLSGLMRLTQEEPQAAHHRGYDFTDQARTILLGTVPTAELLKTSRAVADGLGRLSGLPAWLADPEGLDHVTADGNPFGWMSRRLLRRLGITGALRDSATQVGHIPGTPPTSDEPQVPTDTAHEIERAQSAPPLPDYVGAPDSNWVPLAPDSPNAAGFWLLFARHAVARTEAGMFLGRHAGHNTFAVLRLTRPQSSSRTTLPQQVAALQTLGGHGAPRLLEASDTWLATELVSAGPSGRPASDLTERLEADGPLNRSSFGRVAVETTAVLDRAHAAGVVHGGLGARRILLTDQRVCVTGWAVEQHPDSTAHDVQTLGAVLLGLGGRWLSPFLRSVLKRCSSPVLGDRPTAAHLALAFQEAWAGAAPRSSEVTIGENAGGRVALDLATMGPYGRINGGFTDRSTLLQAIVNGATRRRYGPEETRFVVLGDTRLHLEPSSLRLRQVTYHDDLPALTQQLAGEVRRRVLLCDEARSAGQPAPRLAPIVLVVEQQDQAMVRAWLDSLPDGLNLRLLVLDGSTNTTTGQDCLITIDTDRLGSLRYPGTAGSVHFRLLAQTPRVDMAAQLRDEQRYAVSLGRSGRVQEATEALHDIATQQQTLFGADHPDALTSRYELGHLHLRSGRPRQALRLYRDTAERRALVLGSEHPDTLAARRQCARTLSRAGRLDAARALYQELLHVWLRSAGKRDPATMQCRHELATTLNALGRHAEAVPEARAVFEDRTEVFGPQEAETLASCYQLVVALHSSGATAEARALAEELHIRQLQVLGPGHSETLDTVRLLRGPEQAGG